MRINRKLGATIMRYAAVILIFPLYYALDFLTKINRRWHKNTEKWIDQKLDVLANAIIAWEKNTPENTMELLKKDYRK